MRKQPEGWSTRRPKTATRRQDTSRVLRAGEVDRPLSVLRFPSGGVPSRAYQSAGQGSTRYISRAGRASRLRPLRQIQQRLSAPQASTIRKLHVGFLLLPVPAARILNTRQSTQAAIVAFGRIVRSAMPTRSSVTRCRLVRVCVNELVPPPLDNPSTKRVFGHSASALEPTAAHPEVSTGYVLPGGPEGESPDVQRRTLQGPCPTAHPPRSPRDPSTSASPLKLDTPPPRTSLTSGTPFVKEMREVRRRAHMEG